MPDKDVLDSWKEIAAYLGRSAKTCRRLEKELGLPVHRLEDSPKARVYAYKDEIDRWKEKTLHSEESPLVSEKETVQLGLKKLLIPIFVFIGIVIIGIFIWNLFPKKEAISAPSDKPYLAILYFKNNTGDDRYDFWRSALSDSIITDLQQSKYIKVLSADQLLSILRKLELLEVESYANEDIRAVAEEAGANHYLLGSLTKAGETFRIDYTLQEIHTGATIRSDRTEGEGEESIFFMVDELTKKIKTDLKLTQEQITIDLDREIGEITTNSLKAYKYYIEGRRFHSSGDYQKSIPLMQRAIDNDPEFAMAYRSLADSSRYRAERKKYRQKAFELSDRLSDREKYMVQGDFYSQTEKTYDKAIESYEKLLHLYPDAWLGYQQLAKVYRSLEQWDRAIERLKIVVENNPNAIAFSTLANSYMKKGMYEEARDVLQKFIDDISDNVTIRLQIARTYTLQRNFDRALEQLEKAFSLDPTNYGIVSQRGQIFLLKEEFKKAEEEYTKLLDAKDSQDALWGRFGIRSLCRLQGKYRRASELLKQILDIANNIGAIKRQIYAHSTIAFLLLNSGKPQEAVDSIEKFRRLALEEDEPSWTGFALLLDALYYAEMGSFDEAQQKVDALKKMIEEREIKKISMRFYYGFMGRIKYKQGNYPSAIEYFKKGVTLYPADVDEGVHATVAFNWLAEAYFMAGDWESARQEYEKILALTYDRFHWGDIYAKSFYMLGKIFEQQGETAKAIEHYEKFLSLWKDADPGLAEVEDAREALKRLKKD